MSSSKGISEGLFPDADRVLLGELSSIWDEVIDLIIDKMMEVSEPHFSDIHIDLREEMILELAKLQLFIGERVITERVGGRQIDEIDPRQEREECLIGDGLKKIDGTAQNLAQNIWIRKFNERWKPKTQAMLEREKNPRKAKRATKKVVDNHFIPKSFIRRYWSQSGNINRCTKKNSGGFDQRTTSYGRWGHFKNLYSERLEAYFSLLEGDVTQPIEMILRVEPLNKPQKQAFVGFVVIQRLRNPSFMADLGRQMRPIVEDVLDREAADDEGYMRRVYETLYSNNDLYDRIARPLFENRWVVVRSKVPQFVLPDTCNIFGTLKDQQYAIAPLTPNDCIVILPMRETTGRVIPFYVSPDGEVIRDITSLLILAARKEFLASADFDGSGFMEGADSQQVTQRTMASLAALTSNQ